MRAATQVDIDAPIGVVWRVMLDFDAYPEWNPFVVRMTAPGPLAVGSALRLQIRWADGTGRAVEEQVTELVPPGAAGARFVYGADHWMHRIGMIRGHREQILTALPGDRTRYDTEEAFRGWGARWVPLAAVQQGFDRHAAALKRRAESQGR